MQGNSLRHWAVEELLAGADIPFSDIGHMYNAWLRLHDALEAAVNEMPVTPSLILMRSMGSESKRDRDH